MALSIFYGETNKGFGICRYFIIFSTKDFAQLCCDPWKRSQPIAQQEIIWAAVILCSLS
jgi:hypothetical protein